MITQAPHSSQSLKQATELHVLCLPDSLNSQRGTRALYGIYQHLVKHGHIVYLVVENNRVQGGEVVFRADVRPIRRYALLYRPLSWFRALRLSGPLKFLQQGFDLVRTDAFRKKLPSHDYISALYISPSQRRSGFGSALIQRAINDARCRRVGLAVDTQKLNLIAHQFYSSLGFKKIGETKQSVTYFLAPD